MTGLRNYQEAVQKQMEAAKALADLVRTAAARRIPAAGQGMATTVKGAVTNRSIRSTDKNTDPGPRLEGGRT